MTSKTVRKFVVLALSLLLLSACGSYSDCATLTAVAGDLTPVASEQATYTQSPNASVTPTQETATWTPEPTPTDETTVWDTSCVPAGVFPMNANPCLAPDPQSDEPYMVDFIITPNANWWGRSTVIEWREGQWEIDLRGVAGFAGFAGVYIPGMELDSGRCYGLNFTGHSDLRDMIPEDVDGNISAQVRIHKDDGTVVTLHEQSMYVWVEELQDYRFTGERDFFWAIYSNDPRPVIGIEVGINVVWATTKPGNHFGLDAVIFQPMENAGHCAGISGF